MRKESLRGIFAALAWTMGAGSAHAAIVDKIYGTTVEQGELELELRGFHVVDDDELIEGQDSYKVGVGYGATANWFVEGYVEIEDGSEIEAYELENRFQLSEPGEHAVDFGFLAEIEKVRELDLMELEMGPLFQKDFGKWTGKANLLVERQFGEDKFEDEWEFIGRMQLKYRMSSAFEPGIEYHGEEYSKALGVVAMGSAGLGETPIEWLFGVYSGTTDDTPDIMARWELELEF
jgi:hypothetical protein